MRAINDEFWVPELSRQRRYQLRHDRDGLCIKCREKAVSGGLCEKHMEWSLSRRKKQQARKLLEQQDAGSVTGVATTESAMSDQHDSQVGEIPHPGPTTASQAPETSPTEQPQPPAPETAERHQQD